MGEGRKCTESLGMVPDSKKEINKLLGSEYRQIAFMTYIWPWEQMSVSFSPHPRLHWILLSSSLSRMLSLHVFFGTPVLCPVWWSDPGNPAGNWSQVPPGQWRTQRQVPGMPWVLGKGEVPGSLIPGSRESPDPTLGAPGRASWRRWQLGAEN